MSAVDALFVAQKPHIMATKIQKVARGYADVLTACLRREDIFGIRDRYLRENICDTIV